MRSCNEFMPLILGSLTTNFENKLKCLNQGLDVDIFSDPKPGSNSALGLSTEINCADYQPKTFENFCNLATGEETNPLSKRKAPNTDCGKPSQMISGKFYGHGTVGTQESLYIQGAFVQAFISCNTRLVHEITSEHQFTSSTCASGALSDYQKALGSWTALITKAKVDSLSKTEYESVDKYCSNNPNSAVPGDDPDKLKHQMAVCYLSAARTHLEAMVSYLANCELMGRWSQWWYLNMPKFRVVIQELASQCDIDASIAIPETCWGCCADWCPDWSHKKTRDAEAYENKFNEYYRERLPVIMKKKIDELIPTSKDGCKF